MFPRLDWYQAIPKRVSRRRFRAERLSDEIILELDRLCLQFRFPEARAELVLDNSGAIFKGAVGSYGKIKGAAAYIAFIGDISFANYQERVGYLGEGIILEATNLGVGTCWVGGFFRPEVVARQINIDPGEKVLAVTPVGLTDHDYSLEEKIMVGFAKSKKRKELAELTEGLPSVEWPPWVETALAAARLAPSAVNRQPWRFVVRQDSITIKLDSAQDTYHIAKRLDCGIAMLHLELGAMSAGVSGQWQYLKGEEVAVFRVEKENR
ncbi:nitroreductase family protein [Desulforamulus aeronauticus]|uniref:Nitroreductase n=1 Tax=Desulforamulus aeronauticus DSM 10349 TaxID=1121421 RepID=A0A1M6VN05_9FIRM|nr:nitroreductase family protein [Desulforamulus aeronauticus]SHK82892.1 Nitroreductase [Desulforamulus aeronauticus DSM 10349]